MPEPDSTSLDRWAKPALYILVGGLFCCHLVYLNESRMIPSWDEAHYMQGALGIADGFRKGSISGAWNGFIHALGFKAPLVCVPAAALMLLTGSLVWASMLSLVLTFVALAFAAHGLFRRCLAPVPAAAATALLLTSPLVTGLTHRFYVELLLLLICVVYLTLLTRHPWELTKWSIPAGLLLGFAVLVKITSLAFLVLPTLFSLLIAIIRPISGTRSWRNAVGVGLRAALALATAVLVAWPWYSLNLRDVLAHSRASAGAESCYYAGWFAVNVSAGPHFLVFCVAVVGLLALAYDLISRKLPTERSRTWMLILLMAAATFSANAAAVAKGTRYSVTWLPAIAALAAYVPYRLFASRKSAAYCLAGLVAFSCVLFLHNSFRILPVDPIRAGDVTLLSDRFPLNIPGWFDDNHPVDRRDFRVAEVAGILARDAGNGSSLPITVRIAETNLLVNHYYLDLLAAASGHAADYSRGVRQNDNENPDYIVSCKGFGKLYSGSHSFDSYPNIESDVQSRRIPYRQIARLDGPEGTRIMVYKKVSLESMADRNSGSLFIEAERFLRGNASIDTGQSGYGTNIGVIISPKPPVFAEYEFRVDKTGLYQIELRYASGVPRPVRLLLDGEIVTDGAASGVTGGFMPEHQQWRPVARVSIKSGSHTLRIDSQSPLPCIDRLLIAAAE